MADLSRVFLPFALACFALLSEQSTVDPADHSSQLEEIASVPANPAEKDGNVAPSTATAEQKAPAQSPSIIEMLEGRESDLTLWASIAAVAFIIGWICGGNYYLRRDRTRRTKLRF